MCGHTFKDPAISENQTQRKTFCAAQTSNSKPLHQNGTRRAFNKGNGWGHSSQMEAQWALLLQTLLLQCKHVWSSMSMLSKAVQPWARAAQINAAPKRNLFCSPQTRGSPSDSNILVAKSHIELDLKPADRYTAISFKLRLRDSVKPTSLLVRSLPEKPKTFAFLPFYAEMFQRSERFSRADPQEVMRKRFQPYGNDVRNACWPWSDNC